MSRLSMKDGRIVLDEQDEKPKSTTQKTSANDSRLSMVDGRIVLADRAPVNTAKNQSYLQRTQKAQQEYLAMDDYTPQRRSSNVMEMAINSLRNRLANSTAGNATREWASRMSNTYQTIANETPVERARRQQTRVDRAALIDQVSPAEEARNEARRQQWAIDNAQLIDQASSMYEGPTRTERVRGRNYDTTGADMFSNDWEPGAMQEYDYLRTVRNERYNPLSREDRDDLINRYADAVNGNVDANTYQQILYDVTKNGGIEQLYREQQSDAANDREYGRQLRGVDLDSMNIWQRIGGTLGGVAAASGEQIASSGLGLVASGLNREASIATQEYGPALEQTARRWFYGLVNGADDPSVEEQIRTVASYAGVDGDALINRIRDRAEQAKNSDEDVAVFAYGLLDGIEADQDKIWENAQQAISEAGFYDAINKLQQKSAENIQYAKDVNPLQNSFGDNLVEAGVSTIQNAADAAMAAALGLSGTGVVAMIPFALRAYGGSYAEQMQQATELGGMIGQDVAKRAATSAGMSSAIEVGTEMMWGMVGAMSKVTGGGALDDAAQERLTEVLSGWAKTEKGRKVLTFIGEKALGGVTEGLEEVIGDAAEQMLKNAGIMPGEADEFSEWVKNAGHSFVTGALGGLLGETTSIVMSPMQKANIGQQVRNGTLDVNLNDLVDMANAEGMENSALAKTYSELFKGMPRSVESLSNYEVGKLYDAYGETITRSDEAIERLREMVAKVESGEELKRSDVNKITNNPEVVQQLQEAAGGELDLGGNINERRAAVEMALRAFANGAESANQAQVENVQAATENASTPILQRQMDYNAMMVAAQGIRQNTAAEDVRNSLRTEQSLRDNVISSARSVYNAAERLGASDQAQDVMAQMYSPGQNTIDYAGKMTSIYNRAKAGDSLDVSNLDGITMQQAQAVHNVGRMEYLQEEAKNGEESGLRVRNGLQGNDSQSAGGQTEGVEGTSGSIELRESTAGFERRRPVSGVYSQPVSAASLGIRGGSENRNIRVLTNSNDKSVQRAQQLIESRGYKAVLFTGGALEINGEQARGYYDPETNTIYVRADHRLFTVEQIAQHEVMHDRIRNGEVDLSAVKDDMIKRLGGTERFERTMRDYYALYEKTGMSFAQIFEEAVCDAAGNMNEFLYHGHWNDANAAVSFYKTAKESAKTTAKEVYSRYVGQGGFNKEQSEAIKKAYGVVEDGGAAANPKREALARKTFGTTGDFREAGYLMRNGSMLDFSGKKDGGPAHVRYMDHREIGSVFGENEIPEDKRRYGDNSAYMNAFISEGNIRLMDGQGVTIGEMEPTPQQYKILKQFIERVLKSEDYFYLDLSNNDGHTVASRDYEGRDGADKIIREIKSYFKNGELPYRSSLHAFFSRDLSSAYMAAAESGDTETAQRLVDEAAEEAMPDSEIRNKNGKLLKVYHGTDADFNVFDTTVSGGKNGRAEGFGIYLSPDQEVTKSYGNRQIGMFANITKPAYSNRKTISVAKLKALLKSTCEAEAKEMAEGYGGSVKDALKDTWISNYVDTYSNSMEIAYTKAAQDILRMNGSDMEVIQEVMAGMAIREYADAIAFYNDHLTPVTGFDGFWTEWTNRETGKKTPVILAFNSNQLKVADAITRNDDGNIIPLEERFNPKNDDIRYSRDIDSAYMEAVESKDMKTARKMVQDAAIDAGAFTDGGKKPVSFYHGTSKDFTVFDAEKMGDYGTYGIGHYFADNKKIADDYGYKGHVIKSYLISDKVATKESHNITADSVSRFLEEYDLPFGSTIGRYTDSVEDWLSRRSDADAVSDLVEWARKYETGKTKTDTMNDIINILGVDAQYRSTGGGYTGYLIVYNNKTIKSAEPVVRDNNGDIIPLSERFNTKNDDIRFSRDLSNTELYNANRQLQKDLTELRSKLKTRTEQYKYWKGQTKVTEGRQLRIEDVTKLAREIIKGQESSADAKAVAEKMKALGEYMLNSQDENVYDEARLKAYEIAHEILSNAKVLNEQGGEHFYKDFRAALKQTPIYVTPSVREEVSPDGWNGLRQMAKGIFTPTADKSKGKTVDVIYHDLQSTFGEWLLPEYVTSEADQLNKIFEVVETYQPVYENINSYDMADATEWTANEILTRIIGNEIRETNPTYADRMEKKLSDQKVKSQEALRRVREQRDRKVQNLKEHYQQVAEDRRNRKIDSEMRSRLLKIAKRLNNKKLDRVTRGLLDQYIGELDLVSKGILGRTVKELETLQAWYDSYKESMGDDFIPDKFIERKIARLSKKHISDLTQEEVADLTTVLLNLETMIRTQNQLIESQIKMDAYAAGVQTIDDINNSNGKTGFLNKYISTETATPEREIHRITGYRDSSPLYKAAKELSDGQRNMLDYQRRAEALFKKWTTEKKFIRRIAGKHAEEIMVSGYVNGELTNVKITPAMRMALYLHEKNDDNMRHISKGGVKIPDMALYKKGKLQEAYDKATRVVFTRGMLKEIASKMSADEKAFADAVDRYYNGMSRNEINDTSEALRGYAIAGVEHYYPIDTDGAFLKKEFDAIKRDGSIEGMGILKERIEGATNPIMLYDMNDTLNRSISQHSKYVGLAIPVRNFNKLYGVTTHNYETSVAETLKKNWGSTATSYIEKMMADVQNGTGLKSDAWGDLLARARSHYAGAVLNTNASVAMKQAASYPTAAAVVGYGPLMRALADVKKIDLDKLAQYTPLLWYRSKGFSTTELGDIGKEGGHIPKALNWIQAMDVATTTKLVKAAMIYVNENQQGLVRNTDAWWKAVAEVYNRIIEETQPNYTMMQRPQILRSDNALTRALNMFKTQPFQNFNILYDAFGNLSAKNREYKANTTQENLQALKSARANVARAVSSQVVSAFVFALMQFAWDAFRGKAKKYKDDDEEMTFASWLKGMGINVLSSFGGMIPFGSYALELGEAMTDAVLKGFKLDPFFDQTFYGLSENAAESMNDMGNALISIVTKTTKSLQGEATTETTIRGLVDGAADIAQFAGIPVSNVIKLAQSIARNVFLATDGQYLGGYKALRVTTDPAKYKSDYYALLKKAWENDQSAFEEIKKRMIEMPGDPFATAKKTAAENIDAKVKEWIKEKAQQSEAKQTFYGTVYDEMTANSLWGKAPDAAKDKALEKLLSLALEMGVEGSDKNGAKYKADIEGGKAVGIDATEYMLYQVALQMADADGNGTIKQSEAEAAANMLSWLSNDEKAYLFQTTNKTWKNNPWK